MSRAVRLPRPVQGQSPEAYLDALVSAIERRLAEMAQPQGGAYQVGTVAPQRALDAASDPAAVRAVLATLIRDLKAGGTIG